MSYLDICRAELPEDEGRRKKAYKDTEGIWTAGIGRNLQDVEFTDSEIALMFANDLERADQAARRIFQNFDVLSAPRKAACVNLSFNMGERRLRGFQKMIAAVHAMDFERAADELVNSKWYTQVQPSRSHRIVKMVREG